MNIRILIQKFGGTSLSTDQARKHVIKHIKAALKQEYKVVVVVSAMGRRGDPYATDTLLSWVYDHGNTLPKREIDLLLSCGEVISAVTLCSLLQAEGIVSTVLNGAQAGIHTNDQFGSAQIISIETTAILTQLKQEKLVIVTGFQGKFEDAEITTLGRGGSDTTATALAAALKAEQVDIFTDVDGIMTTDPKVVKEAKHLKRVTYAEISNMANHGAKVVHPRAVDIAMRANIPMRVRSTFSLHEGTLITQSESRGNKEKVQDRYISGLTYVSNISQIEIVADQGEYDLQLNVFKAMAQNQISVDFINVNPSGIVYTVFDHELDKAIRILHEMGYAPRTKPHCSKISIIGGGMNGVPGIMASIIEALTEANIEILQTADSNATIWILVRNEQMIKAIQALHYKFKLHE